MPYADGNLALEALERGQVEAVSLWDPLGSLAAVDGRADVLMDLATDPVFAGRYCCFYYVSGILLEKEPEKIKALLRALEQAHTHSMRTSDEPLLALYTWSGEDVVTLSKYV